MKACPACNSRYDDDVTFCSKDGTQVVVDKNAVVQQGLVGQVIADRYRLMKKLGEGGMGEVYIAEHVHIEKRVALKLLRPEVLSNQEAVTRFKQEARSASSIGHDNIIEIDDFGTLPDGRVYLTMEYLQGAPLSDLIKEGPLPLDRALNILIQTGRGLAAAHAKGIVHRDMKPENVYVTITRDGREVPKLLDFGIAKVSGGNGKEHLTRTGTIFGTPFYMAPEQALGEQIDHRADIYAMGVILYEVFTGVVPFRAESFMGILTQHITVPPVPPSIKAAEQGRTVPAIIEGVIMRAMTKNPSGRYQTMNELVGALTDAYRDLVGPGMTAGFAAPPMSPSRFMPVASGHVSTPSRSAPAAHTPVPTPMPTPMPYAPDYSPTFASPRRGKGVVAILVTLGLLLGAGGVSWYFVAGPGKKQEAIASTAADAGVVKSAVTGGADAKVPPPRSVADESAKVVTPVEVKPEPEPRKLVVLVDTVPRGATVLVDGKPLGETPLNVDVVEGKPIELILGKRGFEDQRVVIDGIELKVTKKLQEIRRANGGGRGGKGGKGGDTGHTNQGNTKTGDGSDELE